MTRVDPSLWAQAMADALYVGGERIPFERVLHQHLAEVELLRTTGLTWHSLAHLLLRAGVQRPDGRPYSADHLRVCVRRLHRTAGRPRAPSAVIRSAASPQRHRRAASERAPSRSDPAGSPGWSPAPQPPPLPRPLPSPRVAAASDDKDVSVDEIAAARARLHQIR